MTSEETRAWVRKKRKRNLLAKELEDCKYRQRRIASKCLKDTDRLGRGSKDYKKLKSRLQEDDDFHSD